MKAREQFRAILLIGSFLCTLSGAAGAEGPAYTFSVNGAPVTPQHYSLNADASVFAPGDVIYVGDKQFNYGGLYLTLGEEKDCRFVTLPAPPESVAGSDSTSGAPVKDGRVFLELPDGQRKVVACIVTKWHRRKPAPKGAEGKGQISFEEILVNPLASMSPEEIRGLWGISVVYWVEGLEQKLAHVNTDRVCITVGDNAGVGTRTRPALAGPSLPPLPSKIRYLVVTESMSPGLSDFSRLGEFRDLLFLKFRSSRREPLDAGLICRNASLRYLDLVGCAVPNYQQLASLTELRFLNVNDCEDMESIEFTKGMRQLRTLALGRTQVSTLAPLDGSDSIREIYAGMSGVRVLPKGELASLKTVNLVSSQVDAQAVEQFRQTHPACTVEYGWVDSLRKAVQGTTRLRVRSGGTCHRQIEAEKTLAEVTDAQEIDRFMNGIAIDEGRSDGYCMCCGDPTFEFYAGERLLAMIGYHHGERLRWAGGTWMGDGELTRPSRDFITTWLSQRGVEGPRQEVETRQKEQGEASGRQRYAELIPPATSIAVVKALPSEEDSEKDHTVWAKHEKLVADAFREHETDARTSVVLYLRILGVAPDEAWNTYDYFQEVIARYLLPRFQGADLARGAQDVMKDEEGMAGAARWFLGKDGWQNLEESEREHILVPLARQALQHRDMNTRKEVMHTLSYFNSTWSVKLLQGMLSRPTDPNWTPVSNEFGRRINFAGGVQISANECSDAAWAAFCLVRIGNVQSLPAIQKLAEESRGRDKDLFYKALQLLRATAGRAPADPK